MKTMVAKTTKHRSRRFRRFIRANEAVSALEYAVLVGVVVVGIGTALTTFYEPGQERPFERGQQYFNHKGARLVRSRTPAGDETAATSKRRGDFMTIKEIVRRPCRFPVVGQGGVRTRVRGPGRCCGGRYQRRTGNLPESDQECPCQHRHQVHKPVLGARRRQRHQCDHAAATHGGLARPRRRRRVRLRLCLWCRDPLLGMNAPRAGRAPNPMRHSTTCATHSSREPAADGERQYKSATA